uniref:Uncharacterized protein n=1 Tax=Guillardia theta TaxID=55529 RepID=A0A7S4J9Z5_GUITH|mmetsp:Transcript_14426/g.49270  ORF Transcript_14426/g.49270 Transcript_14426/m.49270 type:complete len:152 (+) Transcript_14426:2-457(+)
MGKGAETIKRWNPYAQGARKLEVVQPTPQTVPFWFVNDRVKEESNHRWDANSHRLQHGFQQAAERRKAIDRGIMIRPSLIKLSSSLSRGSSWKDPLQWQPPIIPEAVRNPEVKNIYKLQNIQGIRWKESRFYNINYHGKGIQRGLLRQVPF